MSRHELKTWPEFFEPLLTGEKTFELRRDDRAFRAGDTLVLREWDRRDGYTGRKVERVVSYLLAGPAFGLGSDLVVMALAVREQEPGETLRAAAIEMHRLLFVSPGQRHEAGTDADCRFCRALEADRNPQETER